uniref:Thioredoxin n=1 Tax=Equus caballus TaxID=9796 RepID=A0A9L0SIS3_HORSE
MVKQIESKSAFQEALNSAGEKLVVVDFSATWCGPCKMIKPFFHSLSEKYSNVVFLEVDVDDCQPWCRHHPHFTEEKTERRRGCRGVTVRKWQSQDIK